MAIRASASLEVRRLIGDLEGDDAVRRDAAIARLAVIGTRAVRQILEHLTAASVTATKGPLLLALESIPDPRAVEPVLEALTSDEAGVRLAAIRAARGLLSLPQGTSVLDRLTALALNPGANGEGQRVVDHHQASPKRRATLEIPRPCEPGEQPGRVARPCPLVALSGLVERLAQPHTVSPAHARRLPGRPLPSASERLLGEPSLAACPLEAPSGSWVS